jgi:hypothetical protein
MAPSAQALHGKREVRQAVVKSQRLAQQAQLARVDHIRCCAIGRAGDCMLEPTACCPAGAPGGCIRRPPRRGFRRGARGQGALAPSVQAHFEVAVAVVKERPVEFWRVSVAVVWVVTWLSPLQTRAFAWPQRRGTPGGSRWWPCRWLGPGLRPRWLRPRPCSILVAAFFW